MKLFPLLTLSLLICSVSTHSLNAETSDAGQAFFQNSSLRCYPIGGINNPVTVEEYVFFLNSHRAAREDGGWRSLWYQYYYDQGLMGETGVIRRSLKRGSYCYSVREGAEHEVIAALEGSVAQSAFKQWRKNPLVTELLRYTNNQLIIEMAKRETSEIFSEAQKVAVEESLDMESHYFKNPGIKAMFSQLKKAVQTFFKDPSKQVTVSHGGWVCITDELGDLIVTKERGKTLFTIMDTPEGAEAFLNEKVDEYERCCKGGWINTKISSPKK